MFTVAILATLTGEHALRAPRVIVRKPGGGDTRSVAAVLGEHYGPLLGLTNVSAHAPLLADTVTLAGLDSAGRRVTVSLALKTLRRLNETALRCTRCSSVDAWYAGQRAYVLALGCDSCGLLDAGPIQVLHTNPLPEAVRS